MKKASVKRGIPNRKVTLSSYNTWRYHYYNYYFRLHATHREGCIRINLILGSDAKAGVAVSCSPGQVDGRLQLVVHLLVDGTTKLSAIVSKGKISDRNM